jgi:hypothetical protein
LKRPITVPIMKDREPPSLKARLLFKAVDRLSGRGHDDTLEPLQRRKTTAGRASLRNQPHKPHKPESQRPASYQPRPMVFTHLPPRTRCLTPSPFESPSELYPETNEQTQSLLSALPEEILLMIYQEVVGNRVMHIVRRQSKLGHTICNTSGDSNECKEDQCRGFKLPTGKHVHNGEAHGDSIQLLQTCRKV